MLLLQSSRRQALTRQAVGAGTMLTAEINEQTNQARDALRRPGLVETGRSPLDGQGLSYPLTQIRQTRAAL